MNTYLPVNENLQKLCIRVQRFATLEGKVSYLEGVLRHGKLISPATQDVAADLLVRFHLEEKWLHHADYDKAIRVYGGQNPQKAAVIAGMAWREYQKAAEAAYSAMCRRDYSIYDSHSTFSGCGYEDVTAAYRGKDHEARKRDLEEREELEKKASAYQKQYKEMKETLQKSGSKPFATKHMQNLFSLLELVLEATKPEEITEHQMDELKGWLKCAAEISESRWFDHKEGYRDQWEQKAFERYETIKKDYEDWNSKRKEAMTAEHQGKLFEAMAIRKVAQEHFDPMKAHTEGLQFLDRYNQDKKRWSMTFTPS